MDSKKKKTKKQKLTAKEIESFDIVNPNAAGIDIGSKEHWVCVPPARTEDNVKKFSTFTCDLYAIGKWLKECKVDTVAMESTGIYWIPLYQVLEKMGFKVNLINARHIKNVPCRRKTDRVDCQWIRRLHACGLLTSSFRPEQDICKIRTLMRHRDNLIRMKVRHTHHMLKSLEQMNLKLTSVLSDITCVTGLKIIKGIIDGNHNPKKLAKHRHYAVKASQLDIEKALEGDYCEEHIFTLKLAYDAYQFVIEQTQQCDSQIASYIEKMNPKENQEQLTFDFLPKKSSSRKNAYFFDLRTYLDKITHVDLTAIPGIKDLSLTIISEIGLDMTRWKSDKHFTSWLGLAPNHKISGGKILSRQTATVKSRAAYAFRCAASTLRSSNCYLGHFYRKVRSKTSGSCAVVATARKLAIIVYHMLKKQVQYQELGSDYLDNLNKKKFLTYLNKKAESLGYSLQPTS